MATKEPSGGDPGRWPLGLRGVPVTALWMKHWGADLRLSPTPDTQLLAKDHRGATGQRLGKTVLSHDR